MSQKRSVEDIQCDAYNDDPTRVRRVAREMPSNEACEAAARVLKAVSEPVRVRILYALSKQPLCVCELSTLLGMSMPAVSHHLKLLLLSDILSVTKEGKFACYRMRPAHSDGVLGSLLAHLDTSKLEAVA